MRAAGRADRAGGDAPPGFATVRDLAERYSYSHSMICRLIHLGVLPATYQDGHWLVAEVDGHAAERRGVFIRNARKRHLVGAYRFRPRPYVRDGELP